MHVYKPGLKYLNLHITNQYSKPCLFYSFILNCGIIHNGLTFYNSINPAINPTAIILSFVETVKKKDIDSAKSHFQGCSL